MTSHEPQEANTLARTLRCQRQLGARYTNEPAPARAEGSASTCQSRRYPRGREAQQAKHSGAENFLHVLELGGWAGGGVLETIPWRRIGWRSTEQRVAWKPRPLLRSLPAASPLRKSCGGGGDPPAPRSQLQTAETSSRTDKDPDGRWLDANLVQPSCHYEL